MAHIYVVLSNSTGAMIAQPTEVMAKDLMRDQPEGSSFALYWVETPTDRASLCDLFNRDLSKLKQEGTKYVIRGGKLREAKDGT